MADTEPTDVPDDVRELAETCFPGNAWNPISIERVARAIMADRRARPSTAAVPVAAYRSPAEDAAYYASIWGLSSARMQELERAFTRHEQPARTTDRLDRVRAAIRTLPLGEDQPWFAVGDLVPRLPDLDPKEVYNALTYLVRKGELKHQGYARYLIVNLPPPYASPPGESDLIAKAVAERRLRKVAARIAAASRDLIGPNDPELLADARELREIAAALTSLKTAKEPHK